MCMLERLDSEDVKLQTAAARCQTWDCNGPQQTPH